MIMRLDRVDVFVHAADNTAMADKARTWRHPPVRELGEAADKYVIGTAEVLSLPLKEVWKPKQRNASGIQMGGRKSDTAIVS